MPSTTEIERLVTERIAAERPDAAPTHPHEWMIAQVFPLSGPDEARSAARARRTQGDDFDWEPESGSEPVRVLGPYCVACGTIDIETMCLGKRPNWYTKDRIDEKLAGTTRGQRRPIELRKRREERRDRTRRMREDLDRQFGQAGTAFAADAHIKSAPDLTKPWPVVFEDPRDEPPAKVDLAA